MAIRTQQKMSRVLPASQCPAKLHDRLVAYAEAKGMSKSAVIRLALEKFLPKASRKSVRKGAENGATDDGATSL